MKKYNLVITTAALLLCWAALDVTTPAQHEGHGGQKPLTQDNRQLPEMRPQDGQVKIPTMMLNHLLAMTYLQNIATLTELLRDHVQQCNSVNGDFARDVTAEIWRNFDQFDRYRRRQMDIAQGGMRTVAMRDHPSMPASAPSEYLALREIGAERGALTPPSPAVHGDQMTGTMRRMEDCLMRLSAHLIELERETGAANPDPKWVLEHTNAILRLFDEMSTTRGGSHAPQVNKLKWTTPANIDARYTWRDTLSS